MKFKFKLPNFEDRIAAGYAAFFFIIQTTLFFSLFLFQFIKNNQKNHGIDRFRIGPNYSESARLKNAEKIKKLENLFGVKK